MIKIKKNRGDSTLVSTLNANANYFETIQSLISIAIL